jgi:hypothetical protein
MSTTTITEGRTESRPSTSPANSNASVSTGHILVMRPSSQQSEHGMVNHMGNIPMMSVSLPPTPAAVQGPPGYNNGLIPFGSYSIPGQADGFHTHSSMSQDLPPSNPNFNFMPPPSSDSYVDSVNGMASPANFNNFSQPESLNNYQQPTFNLNVFQQGQAMPPPSPGPAVSFADSDALRSNVAESTYPMNMDFSQEVNSNVAATYRSEYPHPSTPRVIEPMSMSDSDQDMPAGSNIRRDSSTGIAESLSSTSLASPQVQPLQDELSARNQSSLAMRRNRRGPSTLAMATPAIRSLSFTAGLPQRSPASPSLRSPGLRRISSNLKTGQSTFRVEKQPQSARATHSQPSPAFLSFAEAQIKAQHHNGITVSTPGMMGPVPPTPRTASGPFLGPMPVQYALASPTPPFTPSEGYSIHVSDDTPQSAMFVFDTPPMQPPERTDMVHRLAHQLPAHFQQPTEKSEMLSGPVQNLHHVQNMIPQSAPANQSNFPQSAPPTQLNFSHHDLL